MKHFEDLWVEAEELSKKALADFDKESLFLRIQQLLTTYQGLDSSAKDPEIPKEYITSSKLKIFGNILFSLAHLSLIDNINVFNALTNSIKFNAINLFKNHENSSNST